MSIRHAIPLALLGLAFLASSAPTRADDPEPTSAFEFVERGNKWFTKGEYDKAIADFTEALRLDPKNVWALSNRGLSRASRGEWDKAFQDYDEAIRLDPKHAVAFYNRGNAWVAKREWDKAIKDYDEATHLDPKNAWAFSNRGSSRTYKGEWDKAIKDYDEAIRLEPKSASMFGNRGAAWAHLGEWGKAIKDYDEAVRLDPNLAAAFSTRALLRAACPDAKYRDAGLAIDDALRACELSEWKSGLHKSVLAAAFASGGYFDSAVDWQKKALADPQYAKVHGDVGRKMLELYQARKPYRFEQK